MNPFASRVQASSFAREKWILPVTGMCLILGFMLATTWVTETNKRSRYSQLDPNMAGRISEATLDIEAVEKIEVELKKLRAEKTKLENAIANRGEQTKVLNEILQDAKRLACQTEVEGPGIEVVLRDSSKGGFSAGGQTVYSPDTNIHDRDVNLIINELNNAGAEAVAVGDHRIGPGTSIRCVGSTMLVNDIRVAPPVRIRAIGDSQVMIGALNINGGILSEIRATDPNMVQVVTIQKMTLPAYVGRSNFKFAKVPKETK